MQLFLLSSSRFTKPLKNICKHLNRSLKSNRYFHKSFVYSIDLNLNQNKIDFTSNRFNSIVFNPRHKTLNNYIQKSLLSSNNLSADYLKSKTLRTESQIKLAQILSQCPIDTFPMLKNNNFTEQFEQKFQDFSKALKDCEQNKLNNQYYPSVTTILSSTVSVESMIALAKWKKLKIHELGEQGFKDYQKNIFARGKLLHLNIKNFIQTKDESVLNLTENIENLWKSLSHVLDLIHDVKLCETHLYHPFLCYRGIVDCVAHYSGKLVVIEWKTSEKLKPTLKDIYDNPIQAVAYLGAINYSTENRHPVDEVVLIYAYENGSPAQIHHLDSKLCQKYWKDWLTRVKSYYDLIGFKQSIN